MTTQELKPQLRTLLAETPDLEHTIEDIITEGEKMAYRWTMRATNQQAGKQEVHHGITFMRIADGKIVEDWFSAEQVEE